MSTGRTFGPVGHRRATHYHIDAGAESEGKGEESWRDRQICLPVY